MPSRRLPVHFEEEPVVALTIADRGLRTGLHPEAPARQVADWRVYGKSQIRTRQPAFARRQQQGGSSIANPPSPGGYGKAGRQSKGAFTLVEILVVLVLLSLIIFALMAVFNGTQKAFRASLTQEDTLEGGRAVMDLIAADLSAMAPSDDPSNIIVDGNNEYVPNINFAAFEQSFSIPFPPTPLFQSIITSPSGAEVTNILENIFILGKNNINGVPSWVATGYSVATNLPDGTLYPLYRFYMTTNISSGLTGPEGLFNIWAGFQYTNANSWSHLMDGVVRLTAQAYDTNGVLMTNGYSNPINNPYISATSFHVRFARFAQDYNGVTDCYFYSNAVPASVQIELGTLEDRTLQHAESLSGIAQSNYLAGAAGNVHVFRQRVWIRNLDPTAYQQ